MARLSCSLLGLLAMAFSPVHAQFETAVELRIDRDNPTARTITLAAGVTYEFDVDQRGIDAAITIEDPTGKTDGPFDSPLTDRGWEQLWYTAANTGQYTVAVTASDQSNATGFIRLRIAPVEIQAEEAAIVASLTDVATLDYYDEASRSRAFAVFREAREQLKGIRWQRSTGYFDHAIARLHEIAEQPSDAIAAYARAAATYADLDATEAALWMRYRQASMETFRAEYAAARDILMALLPETKGHGDPGLESATENYLGVTYFYEGDFDAADRWIQQSLATIEPTGHLHEQATTLYNLAWIRLQAGDAARALEYFKRTLAIDASLGDADAQVDTLVSIATTYRDMGDCGGSIQQLDEALALARQHSNQRQLARIHNRAATCYTTLGDFRASTALLQQALVYADQTESHRESANALYYLGDNAHALGDLDAARSYYEKSLQYRLDIDDQEGIARSLIRLGDVLISLGRLEEAAERLDVARQTIGPMHTVTGEADHSFVTGKLRRDIGDTTGATAALNEAMRRFRSLHDNVGQFHTYLALAAIDPADSSNKRRQYLDAAIELAEKPHGLIARPELRARYRAIRADAYFQRALLDATAYTETDDEQSALASFITINRGQARTLAEERLANRDRQHAQDDALARLQQRLTAKLVALKEALDNETSPARIANRLRGDIELLQLNIDAAAAEDQAAVPALRGLELNANGVAAVQAKLSPGTAILQYSLSDSDGLVWLVDKDRVVVQTLLNVHQIAVDAKALHAAITSRRPYRTIAERLSQALLAPLASNNYDRVLVVPDGALHYLPFAVLPHPTAETLLIDSVELQLRPNGVLLDTPAPNAPVESVAVLADAVYSTADVRVASGDKRLVKPAILAALPATRGRPTTRLPFSAVEADAIADLAGADKVAMATGFAVTKATLATQLAERPDVLHIATHGVVDMEHTGLSGLLFSAVDAQGEPTNEFLSVPDIYQLGSTPSVVVLSACETAVGEYIRSEGPMSIANAFLQQGSDHVVATLWKVADRSTADLMTEFYAALLKEGETPAAALQTAQQRIKASSRWRHPYYWAGFTATSVTVN
ncbi:MAG: CHAT domain-containing protein [Pseudomonadota bacterium]